MSSSSDSEDDCYANTAQRLQKMKNKYAIESSNLLNDSTELAKLMQKHETSSKSSPQTAAVTSEDIGGPSGSSNLDVSQEIELATTSKGRRTRSAAKKVSEPEMDVELPPPRAGRRKRGSDTTVSGETRGRGTPRRRSAARGARGRSRGRGRRSMHNAADWFSALAPIYSIGDAEDVYDQSRDQALFSAKKSEEVILVEETDPLDDNEELSVKVYWQNCEYFKFVIRKYQKLTQIFDYFSETRNVTYDKLFFTYNDKILKPDDTPDSIEYNIGKYIEGGIVNQSVSQLATKGNKSKDGVSMKFQCQNVKKPIEITILLDDKLSVAMTKCAEHLEMPLSNLRFEFDGDSVSGKSTARELELEGGECIDVKIIS